MYQTRFGYSFLGTLCTDALTARRMGKTWCMTCARLELSLSLDCSKAVNDRACKVSFLSLITPEATMQSCLVPLKNDRASYKADIAVRLRMWNPKKEAGMGLRSIDHGVGWSSSCTKCIMQSKYVVFCNKNSCSKTDLTTRAQRMQECSPSASCVYNHGRPGLSFAACRGSPLAVSS